MHDEQPPRCPDCGGDLVRIVYGLPGPELMERVRQREIVLGGCVVSEDSPRWACWECSRKYHEDALPE